MNNYFEGGQEENIIPDAAGLYSAIRSQGYSNIAAIADLIDNSIDAKANNIWISIDSNQPNAIYIADDGTGMSRETLVKAMKLGGKKEHSETSDLGKYGMGLISASLSIGSRIRIITKHDGKYSTAITDVKEIQRTNSFRAEFRDSYETEIDNFDMRTHHAENGTILIIDNCDGLQYNSAIDLIDALEQSIGETFRVFLRAGKSIYLNGERIAINDPLWLDNPETSILVNKDIAIKNENGTTSIMHVLVAELPHVDTAKSRKYGLNIANQGFYILRNGRQIAKALEFSEIYSKHNDYNTLRIELNFGPDLDDWMGINSKKQDITPKGELVPYLKEALDGSLKSLRSRLKEEQKKRAEERNKQKNPFNPVNYTPTNTSEATSAPASMPVSSAPAATTPVSIVVKAEPEYEYSVASFVGDEDDPLFSVSVLSSKVTIRYNMSHAFYAEQILNSAYSVEVKKTLDKTILAAAKSFVDLNGTAKLPIFIESLAKNFN